jgi:Tol biopolymer transport system component
MCRTRHRALFSASLLLALAACADDHSTPLAPAEGDGGEVLTAVTSQLTGRIVFSAPGATEFDIFTINPDGTGRAPFVSFAGNDLSPAWSWDNQTVAFLSLRPDASNIKHHEIFLVDKNGANGHWLTTQPLGIDLRNPAWSPDGSRILVDTPNADILAIDVATGAKTTLPYKGETVSFDPTGQLIAFSSPSVVRVAKADGSGIVRTIPAPSGNFVRYANFSPDGKRLAFTAAPVGSNNSDIYLMNVDGTGQTRLVGSPSEDLAPTWSPDGQTIVYSSTRRNITELWRIPAAGGHRTRLTSGGGMFPSWTH